ncbi:hypothetical protein [Tenacibaculum sp. M341]|uniref:hypothetical protein n=1 Tax=Tenacibaculum sp. M341 TaxID=2530339 RepID=UPI001053E3B9|nr:hypothetical protein [Tenacibaculum sp. M341]TCI85072.1 hypothetical protein EYW44_18120 [Tenacibaculum sp. M341]
MKSRILILLFTISIVNSSYGQFGKLNKLKKKTSKVLKKKVKTSSKSTSVSSKSSKKDNKEDGRPDAGSKIYSKYSRVRSLLSFTESSLNQYWKNNPESYNNEVISNLEGARKALDFLKKEGESEKPYFIDFESKYKAYSDQREKQWQAFSNKDKYTKALSDFERWVDFGKKDYFAEKLTYNYYPATCKGYQALKEEMQKETPDDYNSEEVQKKMTELDYFFDKEVYNVIPSIEKRLTKLSTDIHKKNSKGEAYYEVGGTTQYLKDYNELIASIEYQKETFLSNHDKINSLLEKAEQERDLISSFIKGGGIERKDAERKAGEREKVRVGKRGMSNANYESMAKKGTKHEGEVLRVVITSSSWKVKKNDYDLPLHKYLGVDTVVKKDGKCYLAYGQIQKDYEGAGVYGGPYYKYWSLQEEMNCSNTNK